METYTDAMKDREGIMTGLKRSLLMLKNTYVVNNLAGLKIPTEFRYRIRQHEITLRYTQSWFQMLIDDNDIGWVSERKSLPFIKEIYIDLLTHIRKDATRLKKKIEHSNVRTTTKTVDKFKEVDEYVKKILIDVLTGCKPDDDLDYIRKMFIDWWHAHRRRKMSRNHEPVTVDLGGIKYTLDFSNKKYFLTWRLEGDEEVSRCWFKYPSAPSHFIRHIPDIMRLTDEQLKVTP